MKSLIISKWMVGKKSEYPFAYIFLGHLEKNGHAEMDFSKEYVYEDMLGSQQIAKSHTLFFTHQCRCFRNTALRN